MKILDMKRVRKRAADMGMNLRGRVRGDGLMTCAANGGRIQETGDAKTASGIDLHDVHGFRVDKTLEILRFIPVFSRGDVHLERNVTADEGESLEIIRGDRLLKPSHGVLPEAVSEGDGLSRRKCAIGVNEELGFQSDRDSGRADALQDRPRIVSDLHLDPRDPGPDPGIKLLLKLSQIV